MDTVRIGKYIAARRKSLGLTQQELAGRLGVTNKAVSKWETGQGAPDVGTLTQLAGTLQVTVDELLRGEDAPPVSAPAEPQKEENPFSESAVYAMHTIFSGRELLGCARACWQGLFIARRLAALAGGAAFLALALALAGYSRLAARSLPAAAVAFPAALGLLLLALCAWGYRLLPLRRFGAAEGADASFAFMQEGFTAAVDGVTRSWKYGHVTRLLEARGLLVFHCGRDAVCVPERSLPSGQWEDFVCFARGRCPAHAYRSLLHGRAARLGGMALAGAALLLAALQCVYLVIRAKYQTAYLTEWIPFLLNLLLLAAAFFSCLLLTGRKSKLRLAAAAVCGALFLADVAYISAVTARTQDFLSFSPGGGSLLILKRDTATGRVVHYRRPFLFFALPYRQFPYTASGGVKLQWLTGDVCAVTYLSEQGGPAHQYVATFGNRGIDDNYYVEAAIDGSWEPSDQNTAGWRLVRDTRGIVLSNGGTEYDYSAKDCVQYGLTTLLLCKNGLPQWTVALNEDCRVDRKTDLVAYGGTLTLCKVSMQPTAPLVLRSTSKSPLGGSATLSPTAAKDTYRVRDGVLSLTWDYGHRWTALPLSKDAVQSMLRTGGTQTLAAGCYHIADDFTYFVYGRSPLTFLFSSNGGAGWETHTVADISDDGVASRYVTFTSGQTGAVAVGLDGTPDMKGSLLFTTKDGGLTWQNGNTPSTQTLTGMNFLNQDLGFLSYTDTAGDSGELYETTDGGRSFTKVSLPAGNLAEVGNPASGITFAQVYDTPQVPQLEHGAPVLYVTQGSDGDFGNYRARYTSRDGGKTWQYVSQEVPAADSGS